MRRPTSLAIVLAAALVCVWLPTVRSGTRSLAWAGSTDTNFDTAANWSPAHSPNTGDFLTITDCSHSHPTHSGAADSFGTLTMGGGCVLTYSAALTVAGLVTVSGTATVTVGSQALTMDALAV